MLSMEWNRLIDRLGFENLLCKQRKRGNLKTSYLTNYFSLKKTINRLFLKKLTVGKLHDSETMYNDMEGKIQVLIILKYFLK